MKSKDMRWSGLASAGVLALCASLLPFAALAQPKQSAGPELKGAKPEVKSVQPQGKGAAAPSQPAGPPRTGQPQKPGAPPPLPKAPKIKPTAGVLAESLNGPLAGVEDIVFTCRTKGGDGHWYANFGYFIQGPDHPLYGKNGRLCRLNLRTKKLTALIDDPEGAVRDPQLHYGGARILFSYRKGGQPYYHLYEMDCDGSNLRQLTTGPFDDIEPAYLPDGGIMFCSSRCNRWVNCYVTPVATLYRCGGDGKNIRMISSNNEHDNTPWPLPDGRVIYTRWEYVDRNQVSYHHLWAMNPDGTNQTVFYGNQLVGWVMIDAKPIPGTNRVVATFCPRHGRPEHSGEIRVVDPGAGPDEESFSRRITPEFYYEFKDPYPISDNCFLVAQGAAAVVMNGKGEWEEICRLSPEDQKAGVLIQEPRPIAARKREPVIPPRVDLAKDTGRVILADVTYGRNMAGVKPGEVKKLLVLETLPIPAHYQGGMRPITDGGSFTLERLAGTIPVEPDGSAYAELPALRSFLFVALDENNNSVKRMQSFLSVEPGETISCAGCHEDRTRTPPPMRQRRLMALGRAPSRIEPLKGIPEVFDFPRDIQPILDRHCVQCHDTKTYAGGMSLAGDRGPMFSHAYYNLTVARRQVSDGRNKTVSNRPPRSIGSSASALMKKIDGRHHEAALAPAERDMIRYWIEAGAPYPGTYAALATGSLTDVIYLNGVRYDTDLPAVIEARKVIGPRCGACHQGPAQLPVMPSALQQPNRFSGHLAYNLTRAERSMMLLAPLARDAGGLGLCKLPKNADEKARKLLDANERVFADSSDPGYQKLLAAIQDCKRVLDTMKRFDMPGFRPRAEYVREMTKYGILAKDAKPTDPINVYATDAAYWRSFWHKPAAPVEADP